VARSGGRPQQTSGDRLQQRRSAGFTLIELLVVMLVIVVLAGILFRAGRALQERAKIQQAKADVARLVMALERYYADHGNYPDAKAGYNSVDFVADGSWTDPGAGAGHLWAYLDEDCTYRRDQRAYISGWPKDRLGSIPVYKDATHGTPVPFVLRYYKDPWGRPYSYVVTGRLEDRGTYTVKSLGPNGVDDGGPGKGDDDIENIGR